MFGLNRWFTAAVGIAGILPGILVFHPLSDKKDSTCE
jgi:hypothetical protein